MKKLLTVFTLTALLAVSAVVYAHGHGSGRGHMMGRGGDDSDMMSSCSRQCGFENEGKQKFLDETHSLRKMMPDKRFEYREALRNPNTTIAAITKLKREIQRIKKEISENAPVDSQMRMDEGCRRH